MYQKVLIPLDGSELAECSLEHAKAIAQGCNVAEVIVFRVIEPLSTQTISALAEADDDSIRKAREENQQEPKDYDTSVEEKAVTGGSVHPLFRNKGHERRHPVACDRERVLEVPSTQRA